ncbi:hypothetical protein [Amycolatopsis thailandensis]|uniref:hypothetical protein n=1 Tax=Amycolatopsis thailandensis TaxID=589330 RepID=UPI0036281085
MALAVPAVVAQLLKWHSGPASTQCAIDSLATVVQGTPDACDTGHPACRSSATSWAVLTQQSMFGSVLIMGLQDACTQEFAPSGPREQLRRSKTRDHAAESW